jgi:hypothetical protein
MCFEMTYKNEVNDRYHVDSLYQTKVNIIPHFIHLFLYNHTNSAVDCPLASSFDVFYSRLFCVNQLYDLHCSEHIQRKETFSYEISCEQRTQRR